MVSFNNPAFKRLTLKKVLYHPLTWLAVGFHGLLLVVPFDPSAPSVTEPEPQEEETDEAIAVDILNLSEIASSTPPPAEVPPPVTPPPVAAPPVVPPIPAEIPAELPVEEAPIEEPPVAETPVQPEVPVETPVEPQTPAYDPGQEQGIFVSGLDSLSVQNYTESLGLPDAGLFSKGNAAYFINGTEPAAGALQAQWMDKSPDDIFSELQPLYQGVTFNPLENYGDELLYELQNPNGQSIAFISLVDLKGSTLMVMWPTNPLPN
ncbi:MAG: hypothetical protein AAGC93_03850 [Cyanobacteria bacterium P01_F01_bin.53]